MGRLLAHRRPPDNPAKVEAFLDERRLDSAKSFLQTAARWSKDTETPTRSDALCLDG